MNMGIVIGFILMAVPAVLAVWGWCRVVVLETRLKAKNDWCGRLNRRIETFEQWADKREARLHEYLDLHRRDQEEIEELRSEITSMLEYCDQYKAEIKQLKEAFQGSLGDFQYLINETANLVGTSRGSANAAAKFLETPTEDPPPSGCS